MTMDDYIKEQPELFFHALDNRKNIGKEFASLFDKEKPNSIYIVASGSSKNGAAAASYFMMDVLNVPVTVCPSSDCNNIYGNPFVIYISQGGKSLNTINAIERHGRKFTTFALTGDKDGVVSSMCDHYIEIPCGPEVVGPKTKGYMLTILTLFLMALEAALLTANIDQHQYDGIVSKLYFVADNMSRNIELAYEFASNNKNALMNLKSAYIVGKQVNRAIAEEGALKMMETILISACGFEFEEFLHGPDCSINENIAGFYLMGSSGDDDYKRMESMASFHKEYSKDVFLIGAEASSGPQDLHLVRSCSWYTSPFELIIPFQVISSVIPRQLNIEGKGMEKFYKVDDFIAIKHK